jgi:hypothetical protein
VVHGDELAELVVTEKSFKKIRTKKERGIL